MVASSETLVALNFVKLGAVLLAVVRKDSTEARKQERTVRSWQECNLMVPSMLLFMFFVVLVGDADSKM
jgi:hypothetical protein